MACEVHAQDRVVVVGRELRPGGVDQLVDELLDVDPARLDCLDSNTLGDVACLDLAASMRLFTNRHANRPPVVFVLNTIYIRRVLDFLLSPPCCLFRTNQSPASCESGVSVCRRSVSRFGPPSGTGRRATSVPTRC